MLRISFYIPVIALLTVVFDLFSFETTDHEALKFLLESLLYLMQ